MARYYQGISPNRMANSVPTGQSGGPPIYSMYRPESEAGLTQAVAGRQQRFDAANQGVAQELARMGDIETYDRGELEGRVGTFKGKVNKLVQDKYGGDYSAAANELAIMVGQERGDPFYAFNKQKVEAVKTYQQDKRRLGANFLSVGDPTDVGLNDWKEGATFEYTPINKQDITAASVNVFKSMANAIRKPGAWQDTAGGRLIQHMDQRGFGTPEEVDDFLGTKEGQMMVEEIYNSMPELAGIKDQQAVTDAIRTGAYSAIGRTERQAVGNPAYDAPTGVPSNMMTARRVVEAPKEMVDLHSGYFAPLSNALAVAKGYESMADLQKQVNSASKQRIGKFGNIGHAARSGAIQPREDIDLSRNTAEQDLAEIQSTFIETIEKEGLVMDDIDKIGLASGKHITSINKISDQIDAEFDETVAQWEGIDKASQKNLDKIKKDRAIGGMNIHPMLGLSLLVSGTTEDGKPLEAIVRTPNFLLTMAMAKFYEDLDQSKGVDFYNYTEYMRENNPEEYNKIARRKFKD